MISSRRFNKATKSKNSSPRVPLALQNVFVKSNKGEEVHEAPPDSVAYKLFPRFRFSIFSRKGKKLKTKIIKKDITETSTSSDQIYIKDTPSDDVKFSKKEKELPKPKSTKCLHPSISPQTYLDNMIKQRGYSTDSFTTLTSAYYNKPTELQKASYGVKIVEIIRKGDSNALRRYLASGLSPNPCNTYGESLVHMICRLGNAELLQVMLDHGCDLRVADDYGRTPLHDACWGANPSFEVVKLILKHDTRMIHMADKRGALPLSYTKKEHWDDWLKFLVAEKETLWPTVGTRAKQSSPPDLAKQAPNSRPISDPDNALTISLAGMVSAGKLEPEEAVCVLREQNRASRNNMGDHNAEKDLDESSWGDYSISRLEEKSYREDSAIDERSLAPTCNKPTESKLTKYDTSGGLIGTCLYQLDEDIDEEPQSQHVEFSGIEKVRIGGAETEYAETESDETESDETESDETDSDAENYSSSYEDDAEMCELENEMALILNSFPLAKK